MCTLVMNTEDPGSEGQSEDERAWTRARLTRLAKVTCLAQVGRLWQTDRSSETEDDLSCGTNRIIMFGSWNCSGSSNTGTLVLPRYLNQVGM